MLEEQASNDGFEVLDRLQSPQTIIEDSGLSEEVSWTQLLNEQSEENKKDDIAQMKARLDLHLNSIKQDLWRRYNKWDEDVIIALNSLFPKTLAEIAAETDTLGMSDAEGYTNDSIPTLVDEHQYANDTEADTQREESQCY